MKQITIFQNNYRDNVTVSFEGGLELTVNVYHKTHIKCHRQYEWAYIY